jgi:hypothetical protein
MAIIKLVNNALRSVQCVNGMMLISDPVSLFFCSCKGGSVHSCCIDPLGSPGVLFISRKAFGDGLYLRIGRGYSERSC